jgi:hypothetical protein
LPGNGKNKGLKGAGDGKGNFAGTREKNDAQQIILQQPTPENGQGQNRPAGTKMQNSNFGL